MADGISSLTEKEKETLRLIVRGYDAKSMAATLGLSVHTVNERLREARRKMEVSSSKEAARELAEREAADPKFLADKQIGEARRIDSGEMGQEAAGIPSRRIFAGVFIMITLFAAGLILTSSLVEPLPDRTPIEVQASDEAVVAAARDWLALSDAGDWQASFDAAGKTFRDVNTVPGWTRAAKQARAPLGVLVSRELLTVRYLNAPPRGYQEVAFAARYANGNEEVTETLTLQEEGGVWKVVGIMLD